jgi:membrane fusion protein (multidrug efflux system)
MVQKEKQKKPASLPKRMFWMLLVALVVFGGVFGIKAMIGSQTNKFFDNMPQPASAVTA